MGDGRLLYLQEMDCSQSHTAPKSRWALRIGSDGLQLLTYEHRSLWSYLRHMNAWSEYQHGSLASLRT